LLTPRHCLCRRSHSKCICKRWPRIHSLSRWSLMLCAILLIGGGRSTPFLERYSRMSSQVHSWYSLFAMAQPRNIIGGLHAMQSERHTRSGYSSERRDRKRDSRGKGHRDDRRERRRDHSPDTRDRISSRSSLRGLRSPSDSSRFSSPSRNSDDKRSSYPRKGKEAADCRYQEWSRREDKGRSSRPQDKSRQGRSGTRSGCFNFG